MFAENDIDGKALVELNTEDLRDDLKVKSIGVRKAMLRRIAELGASTQPSAHQPTGSAHGDLGPLCGAGKPKPNPEARVYQSAEWRSGAVLRHGLKPPQLSPECSCSRWCKR